MKSKQSPYQHYCIKLRKTALLRRLPKAIALQYDFSSNDYLGLSQHPALLQAAITAAQQYGVGSKASRLISCKQEAVRELEKNIAYQKKTAAALIFNTGFQANVSVLSALLDRTVLGQSPLVFADRLNHASCHIACRLAKTRQLRYGHLDYDHLRYLLAKTKSAHQPRFIITESVFGMDGDQADLATLIRLSHDYDALLYVDEAHATGLFGKNGYGLCEEYGADIDVIMGTFSKALGGSGAYIACSHALKRYFVNRCAGLIYSTAPSPMQVAAMKAAWELIPTFTSAVQRLLQQASQLRENLQALGFSTGNSTTHLIPLLLQDPKNTLACQRFLQQRGIQVAAIRPPSVPPHQSRLRIALNIQHTPEAIAALVEGLKAYLEIT